MPHIDGPRDNSNMVDHALQYAARGWPIFAVSRSKKPFKGSHGFLDATTDPAAIEAMWRAHPSASIALATGHGLVVLDVDGPEGLTELREWVATHGPLPRTLTARTGNGFHLFFAHEGTDIPSSARGNLHVRARGGFVVLAPSIHPSGKPYAWLDHPTVEALPDDLKELMQHGGKQKEMGEALLPRTQGPAHLSGLPSRPLGTIALKALKQAESTLSTGELQRIKSALAVIPAVSYDIWIEVGMIYKELQLVGDGGSDKGLEEWDAWSQRCYEKYPGRGAIEYKWQSFGRGDRVDKVRLKRLFERAREFGWQGYVHEDVIEVNGAPALPPQFADHANVIRFDVNDAGIPKATAKNARAAISLLGIACSHDTFHDRMLVGGNVLQQFVGEISDNTVHILRVMIEQHYHFDPKLENLHAAVVELALQKQFDPVADYLDSLAWDGTRRLDTWLSRYLGAVDIPIVRAMGRAVLVAAARRVYEPGTKFDQIVVLEGPEGRNKSTAIRILAGEGNFSDQTILTLSDRQQQEQMEGVWLYEIADLTGISRADIEKVKAFASRQVDRARAAYARKRADRPRRCIFFATTNESRYLASQTGNRRFWPIQCGRIEVEALRADRDQLWAEACDAEATGESIMLREELWPAAMALQEARREVDPWDDVLEALEEHHCTIKDDPYEWRVTSRDLLQNVLQIPADRQWNLTAKRVAYAMTRAGWEGPMSIWLGGKNVKGYRKYKNAVSAVSAGGKIV